MSKMRELSLNQANHVQAVMNALDEASQHYKPLSYPGAIAYFAAEKTIHDSSAGFGWTNLAGGGLEIHQVPGTHMNLAEEPHVGVFAQKLGACLDEAERCGRSSRLQQAQEDLERSRGRLQQIQKDLVKNE